MNEGDRAVERVKKQWEVRTKNPTNPIFAKNIASDLTVKHDLNSVGYELSDAYLNVRNGPLEPLQPRLNFFANKALVKYLKFRITSKIPNF